MRITYCAIDNDVFIVQYQTQTKYLLHIRGLKSALYCHEIDTDQQITCHYKADFSMSDENHVLGLFFGTAGGLVRFFNVRFI